MNNKESIGPLVWDKFRHLIRRVEISAKTTLLQEGEVSKTAYFIEKGCLRCWFNNNGKDITFQFFFEGEGVASIESFRTGHPSLYSIESIEPCVIQSVSKNDFQFILENEPLIKGEFEELTFRRLIFYQQLFLSRIKDNPQQRYDQLLKERPEIFKRVPQHYIASYLGMTSVSLSRIKGRR